MKNSFYKNMKITKYILIIIILAGIATQGTGLAEICVETNCCDSGFGRANICHTQRHIFHQSHANSFDHECGKCTDISISLIMNACSSAYDDQFNFIKPIFLKLTTSQHPFSPFDFSKLKTNLQPIFTDMTARSIKSTILVI